MQKAEIGTIQFLKARKDTSEILNFIDKALVILAQHFSTLVRWDDCLIALNHNQTLKLEVFQQRGKHFVLVAGLITSTCVLFTATSAMQHGFLTAVVEDCCADFSLAHQQTLDHYEFIFDRVKVARLPERYFQWAKMLQKFFAIS